jgi:hypothetical protein
MMVRNGLLSVIALLIPSIGLAFSSLVKLERSQTSVWGLKNDDIYFQPEPSSSASRRDFFRTVASSVAIVGSLVTLAPESSRAEGSSKVLVLGGTGFVGSRVVKKLKDLGLDVITTSRDGRDGTVAFDVTSAGMNVEKEIQSLSKGCAAVISCIGAIGTANDASINSATG